MAKYYTNTEELELVADAIREKGGTNAQLTFPNEFVSAIKAIPASSSSGSSGKKDVIFYDYDGTVVTSYSANEFASLSAMPANPTHTGLIAQGWNWSLANAKTYVAKYGELNIGQMYVTQSGETEIDVEMHEGRLEPILTICVNGTITVDWGDNTTPDTVTGTSLDIQQAVPHIYTSEGNYTISILATENNKYSFFGASNLAILHKNTSIYENRVYTNTVKHIRIGNNVEIKNNAFQYCQSLSSITIPDDITSIGNNSFQYCYLLSSITIPDSVTSIDGSAFYGCYSLSSATIPNGVTSIETTAFQYCNSLSNITIPDSVTSIGNNAFGGCYSLSSITIPDNVTSIGSGAFNNCYSISSATIPDGITSIRNQMFQNCYPLSSITIPDSVKSIGNSAFSSCYTLSSITIPDGVTSIGTSAFYYCYSLSNITIPDGVTSIGDQMFQSCYSLSSITIPDGVTSIGKTAFQSCFSLTSITIPDCVTSIGNSAFQSCYGVKEYHILPTTVPTGGTTMFANIPSDCIIYVPKGHLNDYKTATNWSTYASKMQEEPT